MAGLLQAFLFGLAANGTIHAGNFQLTELGASSGFIGLATAIQALGIGLAAPLLAISARREYGLNIAITAGCVSVIGLLGSFYGAGLPLLIVARLVLGCGIGLGMAFVEYLTVARVRSDVRPVFATLFGILLAAGHAAGTLLTGLSSLPLLLIVLACAVLVGTLITAPLGHLHQQERTPQLRDLPRIIAAAPPIFAAAALFGFLDNGLLSMLPDILKSAGEAKTDTVAVSFAAFAGILLFQVPACFLCLRIDLNWLLRTTILALIIALMALPLVIGSSGLQIPAVLILGGLVDLVYTVGLIALSNSFGRGQLAIANACFVSCCGAGEVAGPALTGSALGYWGVLGGTGLTLTLLAAYWLYLTLRAPAAASSSWMVPQKAEARRVERRSGWAI